MRSKQQTFHKSPAFKDHTIRFEHGGDVRKGKRKLYRPFKKNSAIHLILRSTRAKKAWSFLRPKNTKIVMRLIYKYCDSFNIRIYRIANSGNHIHILLKAQDKKGFQNYLRTIAGLIPRGVTGAEKGEKIGKFWDNLAYSKLVTWGRQFKNTSNYIFADTLEAFGIIPPRKDAIGHIKLDFEKMFAELDSG